MTLYFKLTIILQLFFSLTYAQVSTTKYFFARNGFCSTTILLDSLGNFYNEGGCEGSSHISLGTYKLKGDKIDFAFQKFDSLPIIYDMKQSASSNDTFITVTLLTRQGLPIPNRHFSVDAIDTSGKFFQTIKLDDKGQVKINFKKNKEIRLDYLENIYGKKIRLPISNMDLNIILNLPQLFFYYSTPRPTQGNNFSLIIKNDGLYEMTKNEKVFSSEQ